MCSVMIINDENYFAIEGGEGRGGSQEKLLGEIDTDLIISS